MKIMKLFSTTSLVVVPLLLSGGAYAAIGSGDDRNDAVDKKEMELEWTNEDIPFDKVKVKIPQIPNPLHDLPIDTSCTIDFPVDTIDMQILEGPSPAIEDAYAIFYVYNTDTFTVNFKDLSNVYALEFRLNPTLINWRNAENPEDAAEVDKRILGGGYWLLPTFADNGKVFDDDSTQGEIDYAYTGDGGLTVRIQNADGKSPFASTESLDIVPKGLSYEFMLNYDQGAWMESKYRIDVDVYCLDEPFDS